MSDADRALASLTQRRTPSSGVPTPWHEEHTGVHTDAQVFRALKSLHGELQANKAEAAKAHGALSQRVAALDTKVAGIETTVGKFDEKLDRYAESGAKTAGAVEAMLTQRSRTPSGETRAVAKEALAEQVLASAREDKRFSRKVLLQLIAGAIALVTSGAFLHWAFAPRHVDHTPAAEMRSAP
jgi:hypothetical protein